jgi:hypothetical protein
MNGTSTISIEINGVDYPLRFGYASLRALSSLWKMDNLQDVFAKLGVIGELGNGSLSAATMDTLSDLVFASIVAAGNKVAFDSNDVADALFVNMELVGSIVQEFAASMPQETAKKKNPQPVTAPRKKRNKKP